MSQNTRSSVAGAFSRWFRNSKIVDCDGNPLIVYHGTASPSWTRHNTRNHFEPTNGMGCGAYFTSEGEDAIDFAKMDAEVGDGDPAIIPVFLSIQNPKVFYGSCRETQSISPDEKARYEAEGHDGVMAVDKATGSILEIAVFDPRKIKSAIGNRGTYDPESNDIRM